MLFDPSDNDNNRKTKIEIKVKLIDNQAARSSTGQVDPRLFKGGNKLYIIQDPQYMLWYFKYEFGAIPGGLNQKFTKFQDALEFGKKYLKSRNLEITEVID